jgi:hypothetical protein
MRTAGSLAIVAGIIAWLVFSYWPAGAALLPAITFGGAWSVAWLAVGAAVAMLATLGIQVWLVYATTRALRKPSDPVQAMALSQFRLNVRTEAWLTAAPLFMTVALAAWLLVAR